MKWPIFTLKIQLVSREATPMTKANLNGNVYMKLRLRRQHKRIRNARWELEFYPGRYETTRHIPVVPLTDYMLHFTRIVSYNDRKLRIY